MIKMLVFDVDGTLYDLNRHEIPRSCQEAIAKAKSSGLIFVIAARTDALWLRCGAERVKTGLYPGG